MDDANSPNHSNTNESEGNAMAHPNQQLNVNEVLAKMAQLTQQLAEATQRAEKAEKTVSKVSKGQPFLKVGEKGGLSIYRINTRFPVTLYKNQWLKILEMAEEIKQFISDNDKLLKDPPEPTTAPKGSVTVAPTAKS